jgi:Mg2+/citrate symporter
MSRPWGAATAFVAVALAWVTSDVLSGQPLWLRMIASLVTAVIVMLLSAYLVGARQK